MLSKSQIKLITSLQQKKYRDNSNLFLAEGPKVISELIDAGLECHSVYVVDGTHFLDENEWVITEKELKKISCLKTPNKAVALFYKPKQKPINDSGLVVGLDALRDPGNLGTIIRLCDWYGVSQLVCSYDTVDCYNPKVVQATMGSLARVTVSYVDLPNFLTSTKLPTYGGVMDGENVYAKSLPENMFLLVGNEANGISESIQEILMHKITIPQFESTGITESLNVATATAILLSECKRNNFIGK